MKKAIKINLSKTGDSMKGTKSSVQAEIVGEELHVTGLDNKDDKLTYLCRDAAKSRFYVIWKHGSGCSAQDHLAIGPENKLVEAKIVREDICRDGGSPMYDYVLSNGERGTLYVPTGAFAQGAKPTDTYKGKTIELEKLL